MREVQWMALVQGGRLALRNSGGRIGRDFQLEQLGDPGMLKNWSGSGFPKITWHKRLDWTTIMLVSTVINLYLFIKENSFARNDRK